MLFFPSSFQLTDSNAFNSNYTFGIRTKRGGHEDMGETKESESDYDVDKKNEQDS